MIMTSFLNQLAGLIIDGKRNKGEPHKVRPYFVKLKIYFYCSRLGKGPGFSELNLKSGPGSGFKTKFFRVGNFRAGRPARLRALVAIGASIVVPCQTASSRRRGTFVKTFCLYKSVFNPPSYKNCNNASSHSSYDFTFKFTAINCLDPSWGL